VKVDNSVQSVGGVLGGAAKPTKTSTSRPASTTGDKVELSPLSTQLQELEAGMAGGSVVDSARVAEIKQAISEGRFQINPERIADGLLESVQQMLASAR
jgi:negative regulator of flagellin synthesis FlgM